MFKKIIFFCFVIFFITSAFANDDNEINVSKLRNDLIITKAKLLKKAKELENLKLNFADKEGLNTESNSQFSNNQDNIASFTLNKKNRDYKPLRNEELSNKEFSINATQGKNAINHKSTDNQKTNSDDQNKENIKNLESVKEKNLEASQNNMNSSLGIDNGSTATDLLEELTVMLEDKNNELAQLKAVFNELEKQQIMKLKESSEALELAEAKRIADIADAKALSEKEKQTIQNQAAKAIDSLQKRLKQEEALKLQEQADKLKAKSEAQKQEIEAKGQAAIEALKNKSQEEQDALQKRLEQQKALELQQQADKLEAQSEEQRKFLEAKGQAAIEALKNKSQEEQQELLDLAEQRKLLDIAEIQALSEKEKQAIKDKAEEKGKRIGRTEVKTENNQLKNENKKLNEEIDYLKQLEFISKNPNRQAIIEETFRSNQSIQELKASYGVLQIKNKMLEQQISDESSKTDISGVRGDYALLKNKHETLKKTHDDYVKNTDARIKQLEIQIGIAEINNKENKQLMREQKVSESPKFQRQLKAVGQEKSALRTFR